MPQFPRLPSRIRLILWYTLIAAVLGALYAHFTAVLEGGPVFTFARVPRGVMTGSVIASVLTSFEVFVLEEPLGAPLRQASFAVHVTVKTAIYVIVILFALALGARVLPAPSELGIQGGDVLFSLAASFVFIFMLDVNRLLGQNVLLNFITGRYHQPRLEERVFLFLDMVGSTESPSGSARLPSTAWLIASSSISPDRSSRRAAKFIATSAMN
jgi:adenylate cyclase